MMIFLGIVIGIVLSIAAVVGLLYIIEGPPNWIESAQSAPRQSRNKPKKQLQGTGEKQ